MKRTVPAIISAILLILVLDSAFKIEPCSANEKIYIRADGGIDPPTAPISMVDASTYVFTDQINGSIVVERDNIVIDGANFTLQGAEDAVGIDLSCRVNVTLKNLKITGFFYGVYLYNSSNNILSKNNVIGNKQDGIVFHASFNNIIIENNVTNNNAHGVRLECSINNSIIENNILDNNMPGVWLNSSLCNNIIKNNFAHNMWRSILLDDSLNNTICENTITGNEYGILLQHSSNNSIGENNVANNAYGIRIHAYSNNNSVLRNNLTNNTLYGLCLFYSYNNVISENNIANNTLQGIRLDISASNNIIVGNNITNHPYGIYIYSYSSSNLIYYNNFLNNDVQVSPTPTYVNAWNRTYPFGGNYWSDYDGVDLNSGPYQNETGPDGWGDTPYIIDANNKDAFPLMKLWVPFERGVIYIRADGSIEPSGAPIYRRRDIYTLTNDIHSVTDGIVIVRSNMTLDGAGWVIQGNGGYLTAGIRLCEGSENIAIKNIKIDSFFFGVHINYSLNNAISRCIIVTNAVGVGLNFSFNNSITENNILLNNVGVLLFESSGNRIYRNNFVNQTEQISVADSMNIWDNGYDGNYWSTYYGNDLDGDGLGDTPYVVDAANQDNYPLMAPYLYADINHDAIVNMDDVELCCNAFGLYFGHLQWNAHCDINEDHIINMRDIKIICDNYQRVANIFIFKAFL